MFLIPLNTINFIMWCQGTVPILFLSQELGGRPIVACVDMLRWNRAIIHIDAACGTGQGHLLHAQLVAGAQDILGTSWNQATSRA